jgi:hypothetical protein
MKAFFFKLYGAGSKEPALFLFSLPYKISCFLKAFVIYSFEKFYDFSPGERRSG